MLTRTGVAALLGAFASLVAGRVLGHVEFYVLGVSLTCLVALAIAWVRATPVRLEVQRSVTPRRVRANSASRVELWVRNVGHRTTSVLSLTDPVAGTVGARLEMAPLPAGESRRAGYRLPTNRRGVREIGPLAAQLSDPFGLARRRCVVAGTAALVVLPDFEPLSKTTARGGRDEPLDGAVMRRLAGAGSDDLASLRPYVVGDDLRRVHWATSARLGDLVVRQDDVRWQGHITVVLDDRLDRLDAIGFEAAVSAAASVVDGVARSGDRVRLLSPGGGDSGLVDAAANLDVLLERLAVADRQPTPSLPPIPLDGRYRTGTLVVLTGIPNESDLAAIGSAANAFGRVLVFAFDPATAGASVRRSATIDIATIGTGATFGEAWNRSADATDSTDRVVR